MTRSLLLLALAALCGCASAASDPTRDALQQTIVPLCGGSHSVAVTKGTSVAQIRSECKPAAKPQ